MLVAVGSQNPVKIEAVRLAYMALWPVEHWVVEGCSVASSVADQPMSDGEARQGAQTRASRALEALHADYGVGLEGGLQQVEDYWFNCGWVSVVDTKGREGIGTTIRMIVPPAVMKVVLTGQELGDACDLVFMGIDTKRANGHFGLMTNDAIHRTGAFRDAVISALARFLHPQLMEQ
jgi:inosine/xanthosine triphosphatase